jgi:hypothetical protein
MTTTQNGPRPTEAVDRAKSNGTQAGSPPGKGLPRADVRAYNRGPTWPGVFREFAGLIRREVRLALTPLVIPEKWVFVVGCYNSGTELLTELLGTQKTIAALPNEGQFLTDQFKSDYELGLPRMWALREDLFRMTESDPGPDARRIKKEWLMRLDRRRPIFMEKSPPNSARTRWLQHHFENAHFIAIVRNGYAVAEGIRRKAEPYHLKDGWPLELCARQWNRTNEVLLEDAQHLRRLIWIRYEDLVADPGRELQRLLVFLGLDAAPEGIEPSRNWTVHERQEPLRDMNPDSINKLSPQERSIVTREAEPMLRHFGYPILG